MGRITLVDLFSFLFFCFSTSLSPFEFGLAFIPSFYHLRSYFSCFLGFMSAFGVDRQRRAFLRCFFLIQSFSFFSVLCTDFLCIYEL